MIESAANRTIGEFFDRNQWPAKLERELQKIRATERQEFRYKSYSRLWARMRPLAVYQHVEIERTDTENLSGSLSEWYFSESGGLMLTSQARDFYFALQDLLVYTASVPEEWKAVNEQSPGSELKTVFQAVLAKTGCTKALEAIDFLESKPYMTWEQDAEKHADRWKSDIRKVFHVWSALNDLERFACLQQVGSILRTVLTVDVESRLR